jgi:tyrosyl-tRNA synthetase
MLSGVSLIRKKESNDVHALSMPLVVNKSTGRKFGKSEQDTIWLDGSKTTPTQFFQFWINSDDEDIEDFLKIYSLFSHEDIKAIISEHRISPEKREAQKKIAMQMTKCRHD